MVIRDSADTVGTGANGDTVARFVFDVICAWSNANTAADPVDSAEIAGALSMDEIGSCVAWNPSA
jgi:hypothetical protein